MKIITGVLFIMLMLCTTASFSQTVCYVDGALGNDSNTGTIDKPYKTVSKGITAVSSNGTVYIRGGSYGSISISASGSANKYINLWAYPGETPVFSGGSDCIVISGSYIYLKGIEQKSGTHNGILIKGSNNIIENCKIHDNGNTGLHMGSSSSSANPGNNLIKNCDAYLNFDGPVGGNADGFACKWNIGTGNKFVGCRSWYNSDDGWDLWMATQGVEIDSCWAFRNGVNIWNSSTFAGNGNGFKVGGNYIAASNIVRNCVAFDDTGYKGGKGFDLNNNTAGQTIVNCTAFRNKSGNFMFYGELTTGTHNIKNCISLEGRDSINYANQASNSWMGMSTNYGDFLSMDTSLARASRQADGSLPDNALFRLAPLSQFIDKGVDVGLVYKGKAPDMGAFELQTVSGIEKTTDIHSFSLNQNYPNPFNPTTTINYTLPFEGYVSLTVYNVLGRTVANLVSEIKPAGNYNVMFNAENLSSGIYYYRLQTASVTKVHKMILLK